MFTQTDLTNMRAAQNDHMQDFCKVLSYTAGTLNEFNEADAPTYPESIGTVCGLDMRPGSERHGQNMTVIEYEATLRLPIEVTLKETDRIQVTHRFGEALDTALTYSIAAPIQRGPSGIRLLLNKVVV